jgi:hypothetical protein
MNPASATPFFLQSLPMSRSLVIQSLLSGHPGLHPHQKKKALEPVEQGGDQYTHHFFGSFCFAHSIAFVGVRSEEEMSCCGC